MSVFSEKNIQQIEALKNIDDKGERDSLLFDLVMKLCMDEQNNYSEEDHKVFGDILARLMKNLDASKKIQIADQAAVSDVVPVKVVRYLALEPIEIARAVLMQSPVLTDNDLLVVIRIRGYGHMIAISTRENLSAKISAELLKRGDETVWVPLVKNEGATISNKSFRQLSRYAKNSEVMLFALLARSDIPSFIMRQIVTEAGESIRPFLMSEGLQSLAAILDDEITRLESENQVFVSLEELEEAMQKLLDGHSGNQSEKIFRESDFLSVVEANDFTKIVCVFSRMTRIPLEHALDLLTHRDAEPVVLACRAIGLKRETVSALLKVGSWQYALAPESRRKYLAIFDKLKRGLAQDVLKMRLKAIR